LQERLAIRKESDASAPQYKMRIEKDVDVPMRDGANLKADVFRPDADGQFPVLINMGIYQKDKLWIPPPDLEEKPNPHMNWETVNPEWWVPRGYCCVRVDERGSGKSPGQSVLYSPQEAIDFYDAIEWAGHQPWSNGRVATIGISFFARTQWWVANLKPPSLTCIVPWEGAAASHAGHASASSTSLAAGGGGGLSFVTPPLEQDTEITGPLAAQLWVSSTTEDMDLFLTLRNIDPDGNDVLEIGQQGQPVPVAKGWLRVSHRELDPELSRPYRPYHKHLQRQWLKPNEIVEVQVEIWPTSMVFKKGHRIRLDIQPRDGIGSAPYTHYHADYNVGENTIHSGGDKDSFLLVPIIPPP